MKHTLLNLPSSPLFLIISRSQGPFRLLILVDRPLVDTSLICIPPPLGSRPPLRSHNCSATTSLRSSIRRGIQIQTGSCCPVSVAVMSSDLSLSSNSLHSDASPRPHETVASSPLNPKIPRTAPESQFHSLPSHRRSNTEYIARPPIFENDVYDPTPSNHTPRNRAALAWTDTFPKKKFEARARILSDWFQGKSDSGESGINMRPDSHPNVVGMDVSSPGQHPRPICARTRLQGRGGSHSLVCGDPPSRGLIRQSLRTTSS